MSSPLLDANGNARPAGSNPVAMSRIPRSGHHSPFTVSAIDSSRAENVSPSGRVASPTVSSKLPRKSHTSTQPPTLRSTKHGVNVSSARSSLPARGARVPLAMTTPTLTGEAKVSPPSDRHKPLPSPPMAQVVNPDSPPKAQRTLVDAESGGLSKSDWPILGPEEDISELSKDSINPTYTGSRITRQCRQQQQQHRSASVGVEPKEISNAYFVNRNFKSSAAAEIDVAWVEDISPAQETVSRRPQSQQLMQPRILGSKNPYARSFHAFTTGPNESIESPLARKKSNPAPIAIPPRMSSKRDSLPVTTRAQSDTSSSPPSTELSTVEDANTKSPDLGGRQSPAQTSEGFHHNLFEDANTQSVVTPRTEVKDVSEWSLGTASSFQGKPDFVLESGTRIRRLSRRLTGIGPLLTMYPDAEAVLRGPSDQVPEIPSPVLPGRPLSGLTRERSLSALTDKLTRGSSLSTLNKVFSKEIEPMLLNNTIPESPNRSSVDGGTIVSTPIKPIRSMRPPRKTTSEISTPCASPSASPVTSGYQHIDNPRKCITKPVVVDVNVAATRDPEVQPSITGKVTTATCLDASTPSDLQPENGTSNLPNVARKASNSGTVSRQYAPTKATSPSFASSKSTATNEAYNKMNPIRSSDDHVSSRNATVKSSISASSSQTGSHTVRSYDATRSHGPSKLRATVNVAPTRIDEKSTRMARLSNSKELEQRMTSVGFVSPVSRKVKEPTENKVKGKRSFRDMFLRRDNKHPELPQPNVQHKRSWMDDTKSTLAKRLSSRSLSKVRSSQSQTSQPDLKSVLKHDSMSMALPSTVNRRAALYSLEASAADVPENVTPSRYLDLSETRALTNLVDYVSKMPTETSDRLRGLEIAEALLQSVECCKKAEMSAERARKHALDARLEADRAQLEVRRIVTLCDSFFDTETQTVIREYIRVAGIDEKED